MAIVEIRTKETAPRWDLDAIFPGGSQSNEYKQFREQTRFELDKLKAELANLPRNLDGDSVERWQRFILAFQETGAALGLASAFVHCLTAQDVSDDKANTIYGEVDVMIAEWGNLKNSLEAFAVKQSDEDWERLATTPELEVIRFYLDELRRDGREKMPEEMESLVLELSVNGYHAWSRLYDKISGDIRVEFNGDNKVETLSVGQLQNKMSSPRREIRKRAFGQLEQAWDERANLAAAALNSQAGFRLSLYGRRDWKNAVYEPLKLNRMKEQSLEAMWRAVEKALPKMKQYIDAKKKYLNIDKFCWFDQFAPLGKAGLEFSYGEASDFILKHIGSFSRDMQDFCKIAIDDKWIEAEDRSGKKDGGFCTGMNLRGQSRIFMTFANDFGSMTTMAHELGHAYHQWTLKERPYLIQDYPMGLAETASIFSELRVTDAALKEVSEAKQQLLLMDQILQQPFILFCNIYARFLFDVSFYEERSTGIVSRERLDQLMVEAQKKAFGDILDSEEGYHPLFWASKLHFFITEAPFYNFPYTVGFLFATGVYDRALKEGETFAPKYRALLQDTGRMTTEDVAEKHLGVNLTGDEFWSMAVERSLSHVDEFVKLTSKGI